MLVDMKKYLDAKPSHTTQLYLHCKMDAQIAIRKNVLIRRCKNSIETLYEE